MILEGSERRFQAVEHGGAFATRACVLNMDAAIGIRGYMSTEVYLMRQHGMGWLRCLGGNVSREHTINEME